MDMIPQDDTPHKRCSKCKEFFPATLEFFYKGKTRKDGLHPTCRICCRAQNKVYRDTHGETRKRYYQEHREQAIKRMKANHDAHREEYIERDKRYYATHRDQRLAYNKQRRETHGEQIRERQRQRFDPERAKLYRAKNREHVLEYSRQYEVTHRETRREWQKRDLQTEHGRMRSRKNANLYNKRHPNRHRQYMQTERGKMLNRAYVHKYNALKKNVPGAFTSQDIASQLKRQRNRCYYCHKKFENGPRAYHADHIVPLSRGGTNDISNIVIACVSCNTSKHDRLPHEWPRGGRLL